LTASNRTTKESLARRGKVSNGFKKCWDRQPEESLNITGKMYRSNAHYQFEYLPQSWYFDNATPDATYAREPTLSFYNPFSVFLAKT
jgi:hypothetical protein